MSLVFITPPAVLDAADYERMAFVAEDVRGNLCLPSNLGRFQPPPSPPSPPSPPPSPPPFPPPLVACPVGSTYLLRHKRWGGHGEVSGHHVEFHPGGKYVHPHHAGTGGSYLRDEERLVFWEGRSDFHRLALQAIIHPTHGDYSFLLAHGVQSTMFVQALTCSKNTGARVCNMPGANGGADPYAEGNEVVFHAD